MSTGLNCLYFETAKLEWYYVLESGFTSKNAWDWTEEADIVGPFPSFEKAHDYLHAHNANPGGYTELPYADQEERRREKYVAFAARAQKPDAGIVTWPNTWRPYMR